MAQAYGLPLQPLSIQLRSGSNLVGLVAEQALGESSEFPLHEVRWTAPRKLSAEALASLWGLPLAQLRALNPKLGETVEEGEALLVYRFNPFEPTRSVGKPNSGRLVNGVPFPEGDAWELRETRRNHWGTRLAIGALHQALERYGLRYPDGPKMRIGDYSRRTGGRLKPHKSHRSGRDVDFNYVLLPGTDGERRWGRVSEENFDAEKSWFIIKTLLDSGEVESMFVDRFVQKLLAREAAKTLSKEHVFELFEYSFAGVNRSAPLQHWSGHRDHVHVRFRCAPGDRSCR
ncbi:MAG: penicillin-insensitive murein endopeptidase [Myxococcota bacterium]|nr:penicillin-insensitive murein endopeptidase [Myxococcota bacterium]